MLLAHTLKNLCAIIESPEGAFWVLDFAQLKTFKLCKISELIEEIKRHEVLFVNAKKFLQKHRIKYEPNYDIICLSTVKQLTGKKIGEEISIPDFSHAEEALAWFLPIITWIKSRIKKLELERLIKLECEVIGPTIAMEEQGLPFQKAQWERSLLEIKAQTSRLKEELSHTLKKNDGFLLFGPEPIDLNNPPAVKRALEELLGYTLSGINQGALKEIDHAVVKHLLLYRENARMLSLYGDSFLAKIRNDRIHGSFIPIASASGRFACHDPNLLALPHHEAFQACLKPLAPKTLLRFDYGGFELRVLAALSGDNELLKIFNDNQDIHSVVAEAVFQTKVSKTDQPQLREQAKTISFGIIYGMGEHALARQLKISVSRAEELLRNYFKRFSRVHAYLRSLEEFALRFGFAKTVLNRRAYFSSEDRGYLLRIARNMPIQGSGADIVKIAFCSLHKHLEAHFSHAHIINLIHDEFVIECHEEESAHVKVAGKNHMEAAFLSIFPKLRPEVSIHS